MYFQKNRRQNKDIFRHIYVRRRISQELASLTLHFTGKNKYPFFKQRESEFKFVTYNYHTNPFL